MISTAEFSQNKPSVADAMQACEKNSSAKEDQAHNMRLLPEGYGPGEHDVLCGRGRKCFNHAGNVKFRAIVQSFLPQYSKAVAKLEKSYILSDVVEQVRKNSGVGGFIKKDPDSGRWYEVGDFLAREKTSQAFRDVLHDKYKSSNTAKKKRRQEEQAEKLFRAHSSRSLDASSVHSVGSSTTGDYMLSDNKLMRRGMGMLERSDSIVNMGAGDEGSQHDDLLGGLDQEIANMSTGRPALNGHRQRSLRSVLDFDTNRRAVLAGPKNGSPWYNRTSCPNLFAPPVRTNSSSAPPISQIEIVQEETASSSNFQQQRHQPQFHDFADKTDQDDSFGTGDTAATSTASPNNNMGGMNSVPTTGQNWFHHSQPNLFGDAPPVNSQAGSRRSFARQPPSRMMRRPNREHSAGRNLLAGVQQQIGNMGLNDTPHQTSSFDPQGSGSSGGGLEVSNNNVTSNGSSVHPGAPSDDGGNFMSQGMQSHGMQTHGMQGQQDAPQQMGQQMGQQMNQQMGMQMAQQMNGMLGDGNPATVTSGVNGGETDLLSRLSAMEGNGFGMDVIDENPFEPVPLREG